MQQQYFTLLTFHSVIRTHTGFAKQHGQGNDLWLNLTLNILTCMSSKLQGALSLWKLLWILNYRDEFCFVIAMGKKLISPNIMQEEIPAVHCPRRVIQGETVKVVFINRLLLGFSLCFLVSLLPKYCIVHIQVKDIGSIKRQH